MPKLIDHDEYRAELLTKASSSFAESGFAALSMKQLAGALGISHGLFYHYFESKESLYLRMTERLANDLLQDVLAQAQPSLSPVDRVERVLQRMEERDADARRLFLLLNDYARLTGAQVAGLRSPLAEIAERIRAALGAALGLTEGQMRFLFVYGMGMLQGRVIDPEGMSYAEHRRIIRRMMTFTMISMIDADAG